MIKLGNKEITPKGFSKVMRGNSLVWEKFVGKTISFESTSIWTPSVWIGLGKYVYSILRGRKIIEIRIAGFGSFIDKNASVNDAYMSLQLSKPLNEFLNVPESIKTGTQITITYK